MFVCAADNTTFNNKIANIYYRLGFLLQIVIVRQLHKVVQWLPIGAL